MLTYVFLCAHVVKKNPHPLGSFDLENFYHEA